MPGFNPTTAAGLLLGLLSMAMSAYADDAAHAPASSPDWDVTLGAGTYTAATWPGARTTTTDPVPYFDVTWRNRIFLNNQNGLGVYFRNDDKVSAGLSVNYDLTRRKGSDDPRIAGLGDVRETPRAMLSGSYILAPVLLAADVSRDIGGHGEGELADLNVDLLLPVGSRLLVITGPGATWSNSRYAQAFFGVSPQQSRQSGLPAFTAGSGLRDTHWSLVGLYNLTPRWLVDAEFNFARLKDSAAASPVTLTRRQNTANVSLGYKF